MTVASVASSIAVFMIKRRYLRGQGLTFVSLGWTLRRGYRRHTAPAHRTAKKWRSR
jgi:hypothetical protein